MVFQLTTDVTTATSYKLNNRTPVTVAGGAADLEFIETIQAALAPPTLESGRHLPARASAW